MTFRFKVILFLGMLSFASYQFLLGKTGYLERKELKKSLEQEKFEWERVEEENRNLTERKKINLDESRLLEKEARRYYLMRKDSHIIKFMEEEPSKDTEELDKKNFWKRIWERRVSGEKIPPLDILRVFHISFTLFLLLGVFRILKPKELPDGDYQE